ncbi:hypothetical protein NGRA_3368, partial [Nosema granulosis]
IDFRDIGKYVLVAIDYHTRLVWGVVLNEKRGISVVNFLTDLCRMGKKPEEYVTDDGKEFDNEDFRLMCRRMDINHSKVSIESHRSNGRVERVIGTFRESIMKQVEEVFEDKVGKDIKIYDNSYHSGIRCTPIEARQDETGEDMIENGLEGIYQKQFIRRKRETFDVGQRVRIAKKENLKGCDKYEKGRFLEMGQVQDRCKGDSYIVRLDNGRMVKKRHYDLKGVRGGRD